MTKKGDTMKKQLVIIAIAVLLLAVGFYVCKERVEVSGDTDKVEITNYSVTTKWYIPNSGTEQRYIVGETAKILSGGYLDKIIINVLYQSYSKSGFYKDYPEETCESIYIINGTAKNIAGEMLNYVVIIARFYDIYGFYLLSKSNSISNLANTCTWDFEISYHCHEKYFGNVDHMDFVISAS